MVLRLLSAFIFFPALVLTQVRMPAIFNHHMVIQRDRPAPVWGWAEPGEKVAVAIAGQRKTAVANEAGHWSVKLDPLPAGGPHQLLIMGKTQITLKNIMIGEVWLCSGQSNMFWHFGKNILNGEKHIAAANHPGIRLFNLSLCTAVKPQTDCQGDWQVCTPVTVKKFSAVAYFFGKALHRKLKVPVGLIKSCWGGTRVEAWTSGKALDKLPAADPLLEIWKKVIKQVDGKRAPKLKMHQHRPANLYNSMIAPLTPLAIRGAIWYQGEANVRRANQYRQLFPCMIRDWRRNFRQPQLPFGFVQLAPFNYRGASSKDALPELWEAQLMTLRSMTNIGMAITTDIATIKNIHPPNKEEVGRRLALWARATVYGEQNLVYSGPIYNGWQKQGSIVTITFDHTAKGLKTNNGKPPTNFTLAGKNKKFHPATARIEKHKLVLRSAKVKNPIAVRFAWSNTAEPNLVNSENLPASPFRTDDWPGITLGKTSPWAR